eukprot:Seg3997.4 transcript_id=Seg3997.4/GoldUCD/mRNA.D3Y31 product="hypothetical protein" protein_id=Seg3997.4/GoldUCD/D3Y31
MAETTSSTNGDTCEPLKEQFMELCRELNMDIESQETAWGSYSKIDRSYILEVKFSRFISKLNMLIYYII